ncbi:hypothetical protein Y1Q_0020630 [Alligator mississippiensis]|uniref:Uncharacterized protein n=1 Tax=Alligator mississippiensis TaxID=8496 RepID=A0A151MP64_ALLMI|nr:hypothetical protein Y1Q_0020630 [Alligator mississippiensis]
MIPGHPGYRNGFTPFRSSMEHEIGPGQANEDAQGTGHAQPVSPATVEITTDTSLFDELPDLPESPVPKCPGKPWKSVMQLTNPSE